MKYREYQRALGLARKCGYSIGVALNAPYEKLQSEYIKHFNGLTVTFDYANGEVVIEDEKLVETPIDNGGEVGYTSSMNSKGANKMTKPNGVILFEGLSAIDNETPIVVIATGLKTKTANPKTGNMIQTWILLRDEYPMDGINTGTDVAICGLCPHRKNTETGKRTCYVNPMSFGSVYKAYRKGNYPHYSPEQHSHLFEGRKIRWGSYGDPVNIPTRILHHISNYTVGHTGYTHQWQDNRFKRYQQYFMASVDSLGEYLEAKDNGWSTFRVHNVNSEITDINCQGGIKTNCSLCALCNGADDRQKHVGIHGHGGNAKHVVG